MGLGWRILTRFGNVKDGKKVILVFDSQGNRSYRKDSIRRVLRTWELAKILPADPVTPAGGGAEWLKAAVC